MESIASTSMFLPQTSLHSSRTVVLNSTFRTSLPPSSSFKRFFRGSRGPANLGLSNYRARRFPVICGAAKGGSSLVTEITENEFSDAVLKSDRPVLVEFVATWCGPCRVFAPVLEQTAKEYKDRVTFVKIDHDANPQLIEEYKVFGIPTFILFRDGKEIPGSKREGAISKKKLEDYLESFLKSASVA